MTTPSSHSDPLIPNPPLAKRDPHQLVCHGHVRIDEYYWLKDRDNPEVLAYLEAENEYATALRSHVRDLEKTLFEEIKGRIQQTDLSVPFKLGDYLYYQRYEEGKEYALYCRKKGALTSPEEVMLDGNVLARGYDYFSLGNWKMSSGQNILAYAIDTQGRRIYSIGFKNLSTGETLDDFIPSVTGNMEWGNDNRTLLYARQDPETLRSFQIFRHTLGTDPKQDTLVYEERDDTFSVYVGKTKSKRYLVIGSHQTITSECWYLNADTPEGEFQLFQVRERGHEYDVDHLDDHFWIRTNDQAKNFRLMKTPLNSTNKKQWQEVIPHRSDVFLEGFELFQNYLLVEERKQSRPTWRPWEIIMKWTPPIFDLGIPP
ncbi:MAG: hypothetical protein P8X46_02285 [Nitrospirales bacterium]